MTNSRIKFKFYNTVESIEFTFYYLLYYEKITPSFNKANNLSLYSVALVERV